MLRRFADFGSKREEFCRAIMPTDIERKDRDSQPLKGCGDFIRVYGINRGEPAQENPH